MKEDELIGWPHQLNGHEFEQTLGDSEGQGGLACCSPRGCKELDMTERLKCPLQCFSHLHSFFHVFNPLAPFFTLKLFANARRSIGLRKTTFKIHALSRFLIV